jgi:hypothetical protein
VDLAIAGCAPTLGTSYVSDKAQGRTGRYAELFSDTGRAGALDKIEVDCGLPSASLFKLPGVVAPLGEHTLKKLVGPVAVVQRAV